MVRLITFVRSWCANYHDNLAFESEVDRYPNYGKTVGMNSSQWWSNVRYSFNQETICNVTSDSVFQPFTQVPGVSTCLLKAKFLVEPIEF